MTARVQSQCTPSCARYRSPFSPANTTGVVACDAFPEGIPEAIWENQLDHRQPIDGDHGLQWTANEGYEFPVYAFQPDAIGATVVAAGTDDGEPQTGAMIALVPSDPYMLEIPDGEPAEEFHCTLIYLGAAADIPPDRQQQIIDVCTKAAQGLAPVEADGFGVAAFNPAGDEPCLVLLLSGQQIADLHRQIADVVEPAAEQHQPWIPHITLAYTDDLPSIVDLVDLCGPVTFDTLRVAFAGEITDIPLGPDADTVDEPVADDLQEEPAVTASGRELWNGCPRCFDAVHDGSCRTGL